jgi:hypothetical protein
LAIFSLIEYLKSDNQPYPYPNRADEIDRVDLIDILHSGQITGVFQYHNLDVNLTLEGGSQTKKN